MDDKSPKEASDAKEHSSPNKITSQESMVLMARALGDDGIKLSEKQIDRILDLNEKAMDYTYKERSTVLPQHKFDSWLKLGYFISLCGVLVFIVIFKPEYTSTVLTGIVAAAGGYGYGSYTTAKKINERSDDEVGG